MDSELVDSVWKEMRTSRSFEGMPALFLDRDGTIIKLFDYLSQPEKVEIIVDIISPIRRANTEGIPVIVVTNQSGVGRWFYGWEEFRSVQAEMFELLEK